MGRFWAMLEWLFEVEERSYLIIIVPLAAWAGWPVSGYALGLFAVYGFFHGLKSSILSQGAPEASLTDRIGAGVAGASAKAALWTAVGCSLVWAVQLLSYFVTMPDPDTMGSIELWLAEKAEWLRQWTAPTRIAATFAVALGLSMAVGALWPIGAMAWVKKGAGILVSLLTAVTAFSFVAPNVPDVPGVPSYEPPPVIRADFATTLGDLRRARQEGVALHWLGRIAQDKLLWSDSGATVWKRYFEAPLAACQRDEKAFERGYRSKSGTVPVGSAYCNVNDLLQALALDRMKVSPIVDARPDPGAWAPEFRDVVIVPARPAISMQPIAVEERAQATAEPYTQAQQWKLDVPLDLGAPPKPGADRPTDRLHLLRHPPPDIPSSPPIHFEGVQETLGTQADRKARTSPNDVEQPSAGQPGVEQRVKVDPLPTPPGTLRRLAAKAQAKLDDAKSANSALQGAVTDMVGKNLKGLAPENVQLIVGFWLSPLLSEVGQAGSKRVGSWLRQTSLARNAAIASLIGLDKQHAKLEPPTNGEAQGLQIYRNLLALRGEKGQLAEAELAELGKRAAEADAAAQRAEQERAMKLARTRDIGGAPDPRIAPDPWRAPAGKRPIEFPRLPRIP